MAGTSPGAANGAGRRRRLLAVVAGVTYAVLALTTAITSPVAHATRTPAMLSVTLVAAGVLLVGGIAAILSPRDAIVAALGLVAGAIWLGSSLVGWQGGPAWVRVTALLLSAFLSCLVVQLVLLAPGGVTSEGLRRSVTATAYALTAVVTALALLTRDPLRDPYCWHDCNLRQVALLPDRAVAATAVTTGRMLVIALAVVAVGFALARARRGEQRHWTSLVVAWPATLLGVGLAIGAIGVLTDPPERPSLVWSQVAHWVQVGSAILLGVGLGLLTMRQRRRRIALRHLSEQLEAVPPVGSLEGHLARALGDPDLRVAHWLPQSHCFVDSTGSRVDPEVEGHGTRVELRRGDELLAVVTLDRRVAGEEDLGDQLGAATRLALDNERHHAEVSAQLAELRRSRERIVDAADSSRRRLERDLHDGIQAELVALLIEAGRALERARKSGNEAAVALLSETVDGVSSAVTRLRDITHGIYPAELAEGGLEAALWTLTDEAPIPVEIRVDLHRRPPAPVGQAAYLVAAEAIGLAGAPEPLHLWVRDGHGTLTMQVWPTAVVAPLTLTDRVGALGGTVTCIDRMWEVVLPCAS